MSGKNRSLGILDLSAGWIGELMTQAADTAPIVTKAKLADPKKDEKSKDDSQPIPIIYFIPDRRHLEVFRDEDSLISELRKKPRDQAPYACVIDEKNDSVNIYLPTDKVPGYKVLRCALTVYQTQKISSEVEETEDEKGEIAVTVNETRVPEDRYYFTCDAFGLNYKFSNPLQFVTASKSGINTLPLLRETDHGYVADARTRMRAQPVIAPLLGKVNSANDEKTPPSVVDAQQSKAFSVSKSMLDLIGLLQKFVQDQVERLEKRREDFFNKGVADKIRLFEMVGVRLNTLKNAISISDAETFTRNAEGHSEELETCIKKCGVYAHHHRYSKCDKFANFFINCIPRVKPIIPPSWTEWLKLSTKMEAMGFNDYAHSGYRFYQANIQTRNAENRDDDYNRDRAETLNRKR